MKPMIYNYVQLISGFFLGSFASILNIKQMLTEETLNLSLATVNGLLGVVIGVLTCIFLYWQIRKIKRDFKSKKS
jgi:membrane associated rhomboid family serine protease